MKGAACHHATETLHARARAAHAAARRLRSWLPMSPWTSNQFFGVSSSVASGGDLGALRGTRGACLSTVLAYLVLVRVFTAPKAVTTPIAMDISREICGAPALTAALAIIGGIVAAIIGQHMLRLMRIDDWRAHGLAAGVSGSGIAAAEVASRNQLGAAFAAVEVALNGLLTALLVPALIKIIQS
jgi:putative effector of murein hydrolase